MTAASRTHRKKKSRTKRGAILADQRYFDYAMLFLVIFLVAFGLVMLYSTSSYIAQMSSSTNYDAAYYVKKQLRSSIIGFVLLIFFMYVPYQIWGKLWGLIYAAALGLNVLVIFAGSTYGGSTRWLSIGGFSFQPSEAAKIASIIVVAWLISRSPAQFQHFGNVIRVMVLILPIFLSIAYSNLSTAIIVLAIVFVMLFVAHPRYKGFIGLIVAAVGAVSLFLVTAAYRITRIQVWLNPEDYPDEAYQTLQGLYAIGSGGLFGKGLGNSIQKMYVPEPENDMIFTIICEELGLIGGICVIILFALLCWRFLVIANNADDLFGSMISVGVMAHIAVQTILNIAVVTNTIPNTGVVLPFISYGGSSTMILLAEVGIVLSVSRGIRLKSPGAAPSPQPVKEMSA